MLASAVKRAEEEFARKIERTVHHDPIAQKQEQQGNTEQARGNTDEAASQKQAEPEIKASQGTETEDEKAKPTQNDSEQKAA